MVTGLRPVSCLLLSCLVACGASSSSKATTPKSPGQGAPLSHTKAATRTATANDPVAAADARIERADAAMAAWRFDEAIADLEPALDAYREHVAATDAGISDTRLTLGRAYRGAQRWDDALATLERRLDLVEASGDREGAATTLNHLALTLADSGRPRDAIPYYERCLAIDDELDLAEDDETREVHEHNLALAYGDINRHDLAIPLLERILESDRRRDPTGVSTATTMNNLALEYRDSGEYAKARPLYESAIRIVAAKRGADHPQLLPLMNGLGGTLKMLGESAEAELIYGQVIDITSKSSHDDFRATALSEIATLEATHDIERALKHINESVSIMERTYPDGHEELVKAYIKRTEVRLAAGDTAGAEVDTDAAITMTAGVDGGRRLAHYIEWLADVWHDAGHAREAKELRARIPTKKPRKAPAKKQAAQEQR